MLSGAQGWPPQAVRAVLASSACPQIRVDVDCSPELTGEEEEEDGAGEDEEGGDGEDAEGSGPAEGALESGRGAP